MRIRKNDGCNNTSIQNPSFRFNLAEVKCTLPKGITKEAIAQSLAKYGDASDVYISEGTLKRRKVWFLNNNDESVHYDKTDENFLSIVDSLGEALANRIVNK